MNQQDKLNALYEKYWQQITDCIAQYPGLSQPILMKVPERYINSSTKIMIIGQQTFGWGAGGICELLKCYENFNLGEKYYSSPFWDIIRKIEIIFQNQPYSCVWTNINKCDYNNNRPPMEIENKISTSFPVLKHEIEILNPDVIIFFTGPNFDRNILETFPEVKFIDLFDFKKIKLAKLENLILPENTFRTYHPKYLRIKKFEGIFLDFIKKIDA